MGITNSKSKRSCALGWLCKGRKHRNFVKQGIISRVTILPTKAEDSGHQKSLWSNLHIDLLLTIVERLDLIDFLSFRAVCRDWRSASSTASAKIESSNPNTCLLLYGEGSKCTFFYQKLEKKYKIHIPELQGATCLASNHGWLLVFQKGCIIFFCPFSRAKIYLPKIPHLENIEGQIAGFSAPPTCRECVVAIINRRSNEDLLELNVLIHGDQMWTKYEKIEGSLNQISSVTYHDGVFWFCQHNKFVGSFTLKDKKWLLYIRGKTTVPLSEKKFLPFEISRRIYRDCVLKKWIEEDVGGVCLTVPICGTVVKEAKSDMVIFNENVKTSSNSNNNSKGCSNLKGVLIQPRFFQLPNQSWFNCS